MEIWFEQQEVIAVSSRFFAMHLRDVVGQWWRAMYVHQMVWSGMLLVPVGYFVVHRLDLVALDIPRLARPWAMWRDRDVPAGRLEEMGHYSLHHQRQVQADQVSVLRAWEVR